MAELVPLTFDQLVGEMVDAFMVYQDLYGLPVTDLLEGSQTRALFEAIAGPLEELQLQIVAELPARFHLNSATGEDLDRLVDNFTFNQVTRRQAAVATGALRIEGADGASVPANARFATDTGWAVVTSASGSIPPSGVGAVTLPATAALAGAGGNLAAGTVLTPSPSITGITRAVVQVAWGNGADAQTDDELRQAVIGWQDSLVRATKPALLVGAEVAGYPFGYVVEPGSGRIDLYLDDGGAANATKLAAAQTLLDNEYKAAGAILTVKPFVPKVYDMVAEAFALPGYTRQAVQLGIEAAWRQLFNTKRMGDGLTRLELLAAAARVEGYNGVNLDMLDQVVAKPLDTYATQFGPGDLRPYERPILGVVTWEV